MTALSVDEAVSGVLALFPSADRQALQCLAELMAKQSPPRSAGGDGLAEEIDRFLAHRYVIDHSASATDLLRRAASALRRPPSPSASETPSATPYRLRSMC